MGTSALFCSGTEPFGTLVLPREKPRCVFFTVAVVSDLRSARGKKKKDAAALFCTAAALSPPGQRAATGKPGQGRLPAMGCFVGLELKQDSSEPRTHRDTSTPRLQSARNPVLCLEVMYFMAFQKCVTALLCYTWPSARLSNRPGILPGRNSCLQMEGGIRSSEIRAGFMQAP